MDFYRSKLVTMKDFREGSFEKKTLIIYGLYFLALIIGISQIFRPEEGWFFSAQHYGPDTQRSGCS